MYYKDIQKKYRQTHPEIAKEYFFKKQEAIRKKTPWLLTYISIEARCGKRAKYLNIKNYLKPKDLRNIWYRDSAYLMERPAIHRLNPQGNYTLKNCKYVEFKEHNRLACLLGNRWSIKYKRCVSCNSKR